MRNDKSAFPILDTTQAENIHSLSCLDGGMTMRDYFAGQALAGVMPYCTFDEVFNKPEAIAKAAYKIADAMLAERDKEEKK